MEQRTPDRHERVVRHVDDVAEIMERAVSPEGASTLLAAEGGSSRIVVPSSNTSSPGSDGVSNSVNIRTGARAVCVDREDCSGAAQPGRSVQSRNSVLEGSVADEVGPSDAVAPAPRRGAVDAEPSREEEFGASVSGSSADVESVAADVAVRVHVGDVCTLPPAPHPSDTFLPAPSSSVYVPSTGMPAAVSAQPRDEPGHSHAKLLVRMPSVRQRKQAAAAKAIHAFGFRGPGRVRGVTLDEQDATRRARGGEVRLFDQSASLRRNIAAARAWASDSSARWNAGSDSDDGSGDGRSGVKQFVFRAEAAVFRPTPARAASVAPASDESRCDTCCGGFAASATPFCSVVPGSDKVQQVDERQVTECRIASQSSKSNRIIDAKAMRELLVHPQVSHVVPAPADVRRRMDTFCTCKPQRMVLDLRGKSASQVQRELRASLVEDLQRGSDEAAFVCRQLGIDSAPRADQLELMIAAMPGVAKLVFEGPAVESGLDMGAWRELHALHCTKGCSADSVSKECYFRVVHHFLLRGYDPELLPGKSWDDFRTTIPAYVDAWRKEDAKCAQAWDKWVSNAAGLLSEPSSKEPPFVVPLLPATRSRHVWRFRLHGIPYKVRLCLDLKGSRVNQSVADWKFRYRGMDSVAEKLRRGDWLASVDISRFYLRLPAGRNLRKVQWVQDPSTYGRTSRVNARSGKKLWRQLQAIGFGLKTAPAWASVVSAELVRMLEAQGVRVAGCFLDDLLLAGSSEEECERALAVTIATMRRLGIPANEKTVPPQSPRDGITFLGVHIRTSDMCFSISQEHREYATDRIRQVLRQKIASKGDLASVAGVLTWMSFVFTPGRPRRQFIFDAARLGESGVKSDKVAISGALLRQLQWWSHALASDTFVGSRIWDANVSPSTLLMHSDASGEDGWGACVAGLHFAGPWPAVLSEASMLFKEMVPVAVVLALLAPKMPETVFGIAVDNTGVAFSVNKLSCRDMKTRRLLQQVTSDLYPHGHTVLGAHIRRRRNSHADKLSHALVKSMWSRIQKHQSSRRSKKAESYWFFPFVVQSVHAGTCYSGLFRMRRSLFASLRC